MGPAGSDGEDGGQTIIADTPPPDVLPGKMHWESDTGNLFIWYDDGDSAQWVQINGTPANALVETWGDLLPDFTFAGSKVGLTYSTRAGRWCRVGKTCTYWFDFALSSKGTSSGTAQIGLPFPALMPFVVAGTVGYCTGIVAGYGNLSCYIGTDKTVLAISRPNATSMETGMTNAGDGTFTDTSRIAGSITYEVA